MIIKEPSLTYGAVDWEVTYPDKKWRLPVVSGDIDKGIRVLQFKYRIQPQSLITLRRNSLRKLRGSLSTDSASAMLDELSQMREEWERDI